MNKSKTKRVVLYIVFVLLVNVLVVQADLTMNNVGMLISCASTPPIIDGQIIDEEWNNANEPTSVLLYSKANQSISMNIEMLSIYDDENDTLYLGITIPQLEMGPVNFFTIIFHTNTSAPLLSMTNDDLTWGKNNDIKEVLFHINAGQDYYSSGSELVQFSDNENNVIGKCYDAGSTITVEMSFPLKSGDSQGQDVSLTKGSEINFFIFYMNTYFSNDASTFYQYNSTSETYDVCTLKIDGKISMAPFYILVAVPFVVLALIALSYFQKK